MEANYRKVKGIKHGIARITKKRIKKDISGIKYFNIEMVFL